MKRASSDRLNCRDRLPSQNLKLGVIEDRKCQEKEEAVGK